jgi:hypothetical protein
VFAAPPLSQADPGTGAVVGEAPKELWYAYFAWLGVAATLIFATVLRVMSYDAAVDVTGPLDTGLNLEQLRRDVAFFTDVIVVLGLVLNLVFAGLFVLFATKLKAGQAWVRTWLAVLGAVIFVIQVGRLSLLGILVGLLIIGGVVLMNLRPSSDFLLAQRDA